DLDVAEEEVQEDSQPKAWEAWKNSVEEWTTEDWTEDLSETKVFTASSAPAENHVTPRESIDLVALLHKPVPSSQVSEVNSFETSQQQGFGQALVFTNSQHTSQMAPGTGSSTVVHSCSPQSLVTHFDFSMGFLRMCSLERQMLYNSCLNIKI
ncbi:hypothetical protein MC885_002869, partial [Smutsia gigantea]